MTDTYEWDGSPPHGGADRNLHPAAESGSETVGRPLTGARIETSPLDRDTMSTRRSPPHGGADRNLDIGGFVQDPVLVAPSRGRGSKPFVACPQVAAYEGRPLTGARIETRRARIACPMQSVAPSRGRGSKPATAPAAWSGQAGRPLTGARIETVQVHHQPATCLVAPSRGRGSKHR